MPRKKKVLMICLGNTCRSTIAEAIFQNLITNLGLEDEWEVDSAGLMSYHVGEGPNERSLLVLQKHGIINYHHIARVIRTEDFDDFDWILGMDFYNIQQLSEMQPQESRATIQFLGHYDPLGQLCIEDPYFDTDISGFEKAYDQCLRCITSFLEQNKSTE